ncbi:MAG TPA: hypothetical protein VFE33_09230 [Thermoanaerobaculia bacterium]|nr:hypothetical protein [Thermoanaerobaculia bacterium]
MQAIGPWVALRSARRYAGLLALALALAAPSIATAQQKNLVYNTVPPCTVVDTRVAGGAFTPSATRTFNVVGSGSLASQGGSSTGCGIPGFSNGVAQVQAVALYVTSVNPSAAGYIDAYAADQSFAGAVLNMQSGWSAITDSAMVAVAQSPGIGDFKVTVCCATTDVIIRVVGYYTKPVQTVVVNAVPGDVTASGTALINALAGISNASATKPYVVKLGPGIYDVGDTRLAMKPFVDLEGSGQQATIVQGNGNSSSSDLNNGVVLGASSMELRNLQIKSNGSASRPLAIPIFNLSASPHIMNVTVVASGGSANWGIRNAGGSPTIEETTLNITGGSGSVNYGIVATGDGPISTPTIRRTVITITNTGSGGSATGIYSDESSLPKEVRDVEVDISGAGTAIGYLLTTPSGSAQSGTILLSTFNVHGTVNSYGVLMQSGPALLEIKGSNLTASGGLSYGIYNSSGGTTVRVDHSEIAGDSNSVAGFSATPIAVAATRLSGPTTGGVRCAGVYDQNLNFYPSTCP